VRSGLRTERLLLRPITLDTARRILGGRQVDVETWAPGYPPDDEIGLHRLLVDAHTEPAGWGPWQLLRTVGDDLVAVGGIGFLGSPDAHGEVEVGFGLVRSARGAGLAAEALVAMVGWATGHGAQVVYGTTTRDNLASQRTMLRAGLRPRTPHPATSSPPSRHARTRAGAGSGGSEMLRFVTGVGRPGRE